MTQGAAGEQSPAGAAGDIPATRSSLRCAAPRLCCLPGCPSRPHRPHPLPHPLPLRLGPRHRRCRCLRHSRRRFPPPHPLRRRRLRCSRHHRRPPQLSLAHLPHTTTALRASPHAASAPPRPHEDLPPRPPRVSDPWPCSARGNSAPPSRALLPAQPPGDATAASGRESLSSAGWGRRRRTAGGGRAAGRPAARLDSIYGPPLGRAATARAARGEGGALGALAAVKPPRVGAGWPRASGGCGAALRPPERAVVARVAFVRDRLCAPVATRPAATGAGIGSGLGCVWAGRGGGYGACLWSSFPPLTTPNRQGLTGQF